MSPLLKYVLRNLAARPFITSLVLGTMVLVGLTNTALIAVGSSLYSAVHPHGHDNWVVVMSQNAVEEKSSKISVADVATITVDPSIKAYSPEFVTFNLPEFGNDVYSVMLRGLEPQGFKMHEMQLIAGRMPEPGKNEIVTGESLLVQCPDLGIGHTAGISLRGGVDHPRNDLARPRSRFAFCHLSRDRERGRGNCACRSPWKQPRCQGGRLHREAA
jgi:hypothetical protein